MVRPRRLELRPESDHHEDRCSAQALDQEGQEFERRRVDPVSVLDYHQRRRAGRHCLQHRRDGLERPLLEHLRAELGQRIAFARRHRYQVRMEGEMFGHRQAEIGEQRLELGQPLLGPILPGKAQAALELVDHWIEGAVLVIGRAVIKDAVVRFLFEQLTEAPQNPRLADPGLARDERHLALALLGEPPALHQQADLLLAPDHGRQPAFGYHLETRMGAPFAAHPEHRDRFGYALEPLRAEIVALEQPVDEALGCGAYHHRVGLRQAFQPRGDIGCLADYGICFAGCAAAHLAGDDEASVDADADTERYNLSAVDTPVEGLEAGDDAKARVHRAPCVVFVGLGVAEIDQDPVANILGYMTLEATDGIGAGFLVGADHVAQLLGIELFGERG